MSSILILNAGQTTPITLTVQSGGETAPIEIGSVTPSFNGADRSSVRGVKRTYAVVTSYVDTATKDSIINLLKWGAQIPCSGDLLGNIQTECTVRYSAVPMAAGFSPALWTVTLALNEVQPNVTLLRYAPGDTISGEAFTRSTVAYQVDANGIYVSKAINTKRDGHYISGVRTTLLEAAATNLLLRSAEFDNAAWTKSNITVTADNTAAPDGTTTADKVAATATTFTTDIQSATVAATAASYSIFIKQGSGATDGNAFLIRNATTATNLLGVTVNYGTGAISYNTGSTGASMTALGNGWWRLTLSVTSGITSGNSITCYAGYTGATETAGEYFYAWGAQLEATPVATSYIPTTTVAVTRGADSYSLPFTAPPGEITIYAKIVELGTSFTNAARMWAIANAAPSWEVFGNGDGTYSLRHSNGSSIQTITGVADALGNTIEIVARLYGDASQEMIQSINAAASTTTGQPAPLSFATAWAQQLLWLGSSGGGAVGYQSVQAFKILSGARSLEEMRAA